MSRVIIGHFGDESLQSVALVLRTKPQEPRDRKRTKHTPMQDKKWPYKTTIQNTQKNLR